MPYFLEFDEPIALANSKPQRALITFGMRTAGVR